MEMKRTGVTIWGMRVSSYGRDFNYVYVGCIPRERQRHREYFYFLKRDSKLSHPTGVFDSNVTDSVHCEGICKQCVVPRGLHTKGLSVVVGLQLS